MKWLTGFTILCAFCVAGEWISHIIPFPFPGPLIGLLLLIVFLEFKWLPLKHVEMVADHLLSHLSLLFIPAGVGLITSWHLIANKALPLLLIVVLSTLVVIGITGYVIQVQIKKEVQ